MPEPFGPPLKFRAIALSTGRVLAESEIDNPMEPGSTFYPEDMNTYSRGGGSKGRIELDAGLSFCFDGIDGEPIDETIITQFTGLSDAAGADIYFGDVVELAEPDRTHRCTVDFVAGQSLVRSIENPRFYWWALRPGVAQKLRVVGNRWQQAAPNG